MQFAHHTCTDNKACDLWWLWQVDASIQRQYCAAFCGLYYSCKKNNKVMRP